MKVAKALGVTLSFVLLICGVAFAAPDTRSRKVDEFQVANWEEAMARLDNFDLALKNEQGSVGVFVIYGGRSGKRNEARAWGKCLRDYMVNRRSISADRIVVVDGGYRDTLTVELWQAASKADMPALSPTVEPKDVKFQKGKIKNWRSLCNI